jgi:hypothetical protein
MKHLWVGDGMELIKRDGFVRTEGKRKPSLRGATGGIFELSLENLRRRTAEV